MKILLYERGIRNIQ